MEEDRNYLNYRYRQDQDQDCWYLHVEILELQKLVEETTKNYRLYPCFSIVFTCQWPKKTSILLEWFAILEWTRFAGCIPAFRQFKAANDPKFPVFCWNLQLRGVLSDYEQELSAIYLLFNRFSQPMVQLLVKFFVKFVPRTNYLGFFFVVLYFAILLLFYCVLPYSISAFLLA